MGAAGHGAEQRLLYACWSNEVDASRDHADDRCAFEAEHAHDRRKRVDWQTTAAATTSAAAILEFAGPTLTFNIHDW